MGTGIVANAAVTLPRSFPGQRTFATVVWLGAALLLAPAGRWPSPAACAAGTRG
ncbi:hypothetical protein [Streptomyces sp. NPDC090798]|uniref:hypothetical protein n=1 Tax=Streptomyces sp. NPDC090798 TaxID=3365968 RepID=UPI0038021CFE